MQDQQETKRKQDYINLHYIPTSIIQTPLASSKIQAFRYAEVWIIETLYMYNYVYLMYGFDVSSHFWLSLLMLYMTFLNAILALQVQT